MLAWLQVARHCSCASRICRKRSGGAGIGGARPPGLPQRHFFEGDVRVGLATRPGYSAGRYLAPVSNHRLPARCSCPPHGPCDVLLSRCHSPRRRGRLAGPAGRGCASGAISHSRRVRCRAERRVERTWVDQAGPAELVGGEIHAHVRRQARLFATLMFVYVCL